MKNNFLQEVFEIAFRLTGLYKSKNLFKKIQAFLIYIITMHKIKYITDKVSPYYEWYHNIIAFMHRIKYKSDIIKSMDIITDEQFQISRLTINIDNVIYEIQINIPFDMDKNPNMSMVMTLLDNTRRHYVLDGNDIIYYIQYGNDFTKSLSVYKLIHEMNNELYKACKYALSGKWVNNVN